MPFPCPNIHGDQFNYLDAANERALQLRLMRIEGSLSNERMLSVNTTTDSMPADRASVGVKPCANTLNAQIKGKWRLCLWPKAQNKAPETHIPEAHAQTGFAKQDTALDYTSPSESCVTRSNPPPLLQPCFQPRDERPLVAKNSHLQHTHNGVKEIGHGAG